MNTGEGTQKTNIAIAIIIGSALVGFMLYQTNVPALADDQITIQRHEESSRNVYGSPRALLTIVEFSDYQCPFCARLHPDLKRLVDESDGQVSWEYRHLPLSNHPLALPAAVNAECLAELRGNGAFWEYTDELFENQAILDATYIDTKALALGLGADELAACKTDQLIQDRIALDAEAARALGGSGTPFSLIVYPDNTYKVISGAVPYEQLKPLVTNYDE